MNWTTIALIGGLVLVLLMLAYFASNRNPDQDKLSDTQLNTATTASASPEKRCASKRTYDLLKREIFRRAAQRRGSDAAAFDKLSGFAVLRMENPVMESADEKANVVQCSGAVSIDLPPGVAAAGGRRTLMSDVDFTVQPAADGSGDVVLLRNAEAIVGPLSAIARAAQPAPAAPPVPAAPPAAPLDSSGAPAAPAPPAPPAPAPAPPPPQRVSANPSFNCAKARTRGEIAVCADPGLASLDRQMAAQFNRAISVADDRQRFILLRTRADFLQFRDSCRGERCIADAYVGRMREIANIMSRP